jgi:hypothetical protein
VPSPEITLHCYLCGIFRVYVERVMFCNGEGNGNGKVYPSTGHEGPEGE